MGIMLTAWAQKNEHCLSWHCTNAADSAIVLQHLSNPACFDDSLTCQKALSKLLENLYKQAYMAASIDSFEQNALQSTALLHVGQRFEAKSIAILGLDKRHLQRIGGLQPLSEHQKLSANYITHLQDRILRYAENNGYPFAQLAWQNVEFDAQNRFSGKLLCTLNNAYRLDTLRIEGNARISRRYLWRYLHLAPNALYSEADIKQASIRLRELPFLQETHPPSVQFDLAQKAQVSLFLKPRKASRFDFVLGILPNNTSLSGGSQQGASYQISGEGLLNLQNALSAGELIDLQFKNYPNNIKELKTHVTYPYLPLLPLGADVKFELYLRDTLFRNIQTYLGLQYLMRGNNYWKTYVQWFASDMLSIDTSRIVLSRSLPNVLDARSVLYGVAYNFEQLDYRLNPRRGFLLHLNMGIGTKAFKTNKAIVALGKNIETDFEAQYDSLNKQKIVGQLETKIAKYWAIGKHSTVFWAIQGAWKPPNITLLNETYRIGGSRLLRGFSEESILATFYGVNTVEYRYLFGQNAAAFAFCDVAYSENRSRQAQANSSRFLSFGAGLNFETKAGIFGLVYALGKQNNAKFDFRAGKIHFAYLNYF